jgi:integrase
MVRSDERAKLNERTVEGLEAPDSGNKVYYFADAVIQGAKAPRGFGVRVTAGGARSFVLNYRAAHVERRHTIGQWPDWSVIKAVQEARKLRQRVDRGEDPQLDRRRADNAGKDTLKAICEEYFVRECGMKRDARGQPVWSENGKLRTGSQRLRTCERLVYSELGDRQIDTIKRTQIVRLLDKVQEGSGARMADDVLAVLRKIMNWHAARSDEFRSPIVKGMARTKPKERQRTRTLSDAELQLVWRHSADAGPYGAMLRFFLLTSARLSEARLMVWKELEGKDWTLPAARNKTKVDLVRPLSDAALAALPKKPIGGCEFVFTLDGERPIGGLSKFKRRLDDAILADLRKQDPKAKALPRWTPHDLRRTARSLMSRAGVLSDHAELCLGHVLVGVRGTYDRYKFYEEKKAAFEKLGALVERILNPVDNVTPIAARPGR